MQPSSRTIVGNKRGALLLGEGVVLNGWEVKGFIEKELFSDRVPSQTRNCIQNKYNEDTF